MGQKQTPKEIKTKRRQVKPRTIRQYRSRYATGALSPYMRVEPTCDLGQCTRSHYQQPATEPTQFLGEQWGAKYGRCYRWMFEDSSLVFSFCEYHHRDVMEQYLFRQLRLGVI